MVPTRDILAFGTTDTYKSFTCFNNGFIKAMVLVVPNFTGPATEVHQIEVKDEESNVIYTSTTGWAENTTHLISSLSIPVDKNYSIKLTLDGAAGGSHNVIVKTYINTKE